VTKLNLNKLEEEQEKLELALKHKLLENPSEQNFQEAYDEIHNFLIEQGKTESIYSENLKWFTRIFVDLCGSGNKILDIGSGNGKLALEMAKKGNSVTGLDVSKIAIRASEERMKKIAPHLQIEFKLGDARKLPFEDNTFNYITSQDLIEHISEDDFKIHLKEVYRVLKTGGSYVFWTPSSLRGGSSLGLHLKEYSISEMDKIIRKTNFNYSWIDIRFYVLKIKVKINQSFMAPVLLYENLLGKLIRFIPDGINKIVVPRLLFQLKKLK
jgi:ubiquinone/menaquinone biosynthesis C-methylase UbiE